MSLFLACVIYMIWLVEDLGSELQINKLVNAYSQCKVLNRL